MTPDQIEEKLRSVELKIIDWLNKKSNFQLSLIMAFFLAFSYFMISGQFTFKYTFMYFLNFTYSFITILLISFASIGMLYFKLEKSRLVWVSAVFIFCTFADFLGSKWVDPSGDNWGWVFIFVQIILGYVAWNLKNKFSKAVIIWSYLSMTFLLYYVGYKFTSSIGWYYFRQPIIYCGFVIVIILEDIELPLRRRLLLLLNPAHLFLSVNYPIDNYLKGNEEDKRVWGSGLLHLFKAMFFLYIACVFFKLFSGELSIFLASLKDYIMYLLVVTAVGNTVTGLSRLFLINVTACCNFVILSSSPLDFMKRENVHAYIFSLRFFYFNFLRLTKSPFVIILGYFLIFPFYRNILLYFSRNVSFDFQGFYLYLLYGYLFWTLLLIAIIGFPEKLLRKYVTNKWHHITLNIMFMYGVFLGYRYLVPILVTTK